MKSIRRHQAARGLTLVELAVTMTVMGILASLALPSFQAQVNKVRRQEALAEIQRISLAQERWRADNPSYANTVGALNGHGLVAALNASSITTRSGFYTVSTQALPARPGSAYTVTARANGRMTQDAPCQSMTITIDAGVATVTATPTPDPDLCWGR